VEFAKRHAVALGQCPVWLFSSGPLGTEAKDEEAMSQRQLAELTELLHPRDHVGDLPESHLLAGVHGVRRVQGSRGVTAGITAVDKIGDRLNMVVAHRCLRGMWLLRMLGSSLVGGVRLRAMDGAIGVLGRGVQRVEL
jgi:hypothetical protein